MRFNVLYIMLIIIFVLFYLNSISCFPEEIKVAVLFEENNGLKSAFMRAIGIINSNDLPGSTKLTALMESFVAENSLRMSNKVCEFIWIGINAIFGPKSPTAANHIQSIADEMNIPYLQFTYRPNARKSPMSVNFYPHIALSSAILSLTKIRKLERFGILYDSDEALITYKDIIAAKEHSGINFYQLDPHSYESTIDDIQQNGDYTIIIDCKTSEITTILNKIQKKGMMTSDYYFIVTSLDLHTINLQDFKESGANITAFQLVNIKELTNLELSTLTTEEALVSDAARLFAKSLHSADTENLITPVSLNCSQFNSWGSGIRLVNHILNTTFEDLTGKIVFDASGERTNVSLKLVELTTTGLQQVGTWNTSHGLQFNRSGIIQNIVRSTESITKTLIITTILQKPYVTLKEGSATSQLSGNNRFEGFCVDLIDRLANIIKFEYNIQLVKDGRYGMFSNGTWNGMIGEINSKHADIAVAPLTTTSIRETHIDFTKPFMHLGIGILFKKPDISSHGLFFIFAPFSTTTWICIIISIIVMAITNYFIILFSPTVQGSDFLSSRRNKQWLFSILNSLWTTFRSFLFQGFTAPYKSFSSRTLYIFWWIFVIFIVCAYAANLAAYLVVERKQLAANSLQELLDQPDIKFGVISGGSTERFFKTHSEPVYRRLAMTMEAEGITLKSVEEGVGKVKQGNFAFFMESTMIEYVTERDCDLVQIGGLLDYKGYGLAVAKNSPLRDKLSVAILQLQEHGEINKLKNKWFKHPSSPCLPENLKFTIDKLDLSSVGGAFILLLLGILLSGFVLVLESCLNLKINDVDADKEIMLNN